ncbi:hypothetical protein BHE74_00014922 [Ensete ventricosum]|nr:hypothetical protein BHE74_00014922 [Ensete ventricosum]RZR89934.1 hypothetical protein BHM03_00017745 [Ensete ventricosum]
MFYQESINIVQYRILIFRRSCSNPCVAMNRMNYFVSVARLMAHVNTFHFQS